MSSCDRPCGSHGSCRGVVLRIETGGWAKCCKTIMANGFVLTYMGMGTAKNFILRRLMGENVNKNMSVIKDVIVEFE